LSPTATEPKQALRKLLADGPIQIVVNNAGFTMTP